MTQEQAVVEQTAEQTASDAAAFESGFNQDAPQKPEPKAEVVVEAPKKEEPQKEPPKAAAPDALTEIAKLDHRFKSFEGRLGKIDQSLATLAAAKAAATTVSDAPSKAQIDQASTSTERWKQLKSDFPDWADAMEEKLAGFATPAAVSETAAKIVEERLKALPKPDQSAAVAEARELARIDRKYEDWESTVAAPEFSAWLQKQAPAIQALASSPKAKDAIAMLDAYEESRKKPADKSATNERLKRAAPAKGANAAPQTLNEDDAFERGFNGP